MDNKTMLLVDVLAKEIHALDAALKCEQRLVSQYGEDIEKVIREREHYKSQVQSLEGIIKEGRSANLKQTEQIAELSKMNTDVIDINFRLEKENKDAITQTIALSKKLNEVITERTNLDEEIIELKKQLREVSIGDFVDLYAGDHEYFSVFDSEGILRKIPRKGIE